ncbi:MAG: hypothetical protein CYPHOPRED_005020 [Cyphobasidiales sp. Tagirdzhanova-0007]|nr:MAG: hypothetical protein CYPHOPRED_005020 [Cyphobasidiales sp. Tagirdzhanova-0007]
MHSTSAIDQGSCKKPEEASIVRPYMLSRHNDQVVPPILHFVFGLNQTFGGKNFGYVAYLSMYSAMVETKPKRVMFWYLFLPTTIEEGVWWLEEIEDEVERLGIKFELKEARHFDNIFGNPIAQYAHKADIIRLEALLEYGGIYLDLDVISIRSYAPLMHFDTVIGLEGGLDHLPRQGVCNALIISRPNSTFLQRWYQSYHTFKDKDWAAHSVALPFRMAVSHPEEVLIMDPYSFFYPLWNDRGIRMVHSRSAELYGEGWDFNEGHQFAYHAWSSLAEKWLKKLTPDKVFEVETSFNLLVRRWTTERLRENWRNAVKEGHV